MAIVGQTGFSSSFSSPPRFAEEALALRSACITKQIGGQTDSPSLFAPTAQLGQTGCLSSSSNQSCVYEPHATRTSSPTANPPDPPTKRIPNNHRSRERADQPTDPLKKTPFTDVQPRTFCIICCLLFPLLPFVFGLSDIVEADSHLIVEAPQI